MIPRARLGAGSLALALVLAACGGAEEAPTSGGGGGGGAGGGAIGDSTMGRIDAPPLEWTYVPFSDAHCANGGPAGIAVNPSEKSKGLLVFFMGGGACWDYETCYVDNLAFDFQNGYSQANFDAERVVILAGGVFDRSDPKNTFKDYSFVYVPYCTGDVHAGSNPHQQYQDRVAMHVGGSNFVKFMKRIQPTFPDADRVTVTGISAGGFGAGFNFWRVREAYPSAKVNLLDDSGPPLPAPYLKPDLEQTWRTVWNLDASFPPGCTGCETSFDALFDYYAKEYPTSRVGLLSYMNDSTISFFFQISKQEMADGLDALAAKSFDPNPSARYFFEAGDKHVLSLFNLPSVTQNGVALEEWIRQMNEDDPAWTSVHP
jgi:hypothetical protein